MNRMELALGELKRERQERIALIAEINEKIEHLNTVISMIESDPPEVLAAPQTQCEEFYEAQPVSAKPLMSVFEFAQKYDKSLTWEYACEFAEAYAEYRSKLYWM